MTICDMRVPIDYIPRSNILGYYGKHPPFVLTITKIFIGLDMQIDIFDKSNMELIRLIKCPDIWGRVILMEKNFVALKHKTHIARQSEMTNTSPRHMPVLGNVHPIKIENFDIFS